MGSLTEYKSMLQPRNATDMNGTLPQSQSLGVKATCSTQYLSYSNPKGEDPWCKSGRFMTPDLYLVKTKMDLFLSLALPILKINTSF